MGEDDPEFVQEMIQQFLTDAPGLVTALRDGIEAGDAEGVRRAAHTLKSNAHTFGALPLGERCAALEMTAKAGDLSDAGAAVEAIAEDLGRVQTDLPPAWQAIAGGER
jgi:HPt (histidine-containing phosphotransfer) domain-containing protein